jgi:hypothetical protein
LASKRWEKLTSDQREAAEMLGYTSIQWNDLERETESGATEQSSQSGKLIVQNTTMPLITRPKNGPPIFQLPTTQILCKLNKFEVVCSNVTRTSSVEAYPLFAEYYTDGDGAHIPKQTTPQQRPISTDWYKPDAAKVCGGRIDQPCANLGDELGPMLLLKLSGQEYIENRYDGMDVVIIGSVLNFIVQKYGKTAERLGSHYNVTVWGTGTK